MRGFKINTFYPYLQTRKTGFLSLQIAPPRNSRTLELGLELQKLLVI